MLNYVWSTIHREENTAIPPSDFQSSYLILHQRREALTQEEMKISQQQINSISNGDQNKDGSIFIRNPWKPPSTVFHSERFRKMCFSSLVNEGKEKQHFFKHFFFFPVHLQLTATSNFLSLT